MRLPVLSTGVIRAGRSSVVRIGVDGPVPPGRDLGRLPADHERPARLGGSCDGGRRPDLVRMRSLRSERIRWNG